MRNLLARARLAFFAGLAAVVVYSGGIAQAQTADPVASQIEAFDSSLLTATRAGGGGARELSPVVDRVFNVPVMAQFIVGPAWAQWTPADRNAVATALRAYVVARFVHEFAGAGQTIALVPDVQARGADRLVRTSVRTPGEDPDQINYRMRQYDGRWRVIDIYYNGVSELTTQRADAAGAIASGGARALIQRLETSTAALR